MLFWRMKINYRHYALRSNILMSNKTKTIGTIFNNFLLKDVMNNLTVVIETPKGSSEKYNYHFFTILSALRDRRKYAVVQVFLLHSTAVRSRSPL